jgi:hypothetical protein
LSFDSIAIIMSIAIVVVIIIYIIAVLLCCCVIRCGEEGGASDVEAMPTAAAYAATPSGTGAENAPPAGTADASSLSGAGAAGAIAVVEVAVTADEVTLRATGTMLTTFC